MDKWCMEEPKSTSTLSTKPKPGNRRSDRSLEMCNALDKSKRSWGSGGRVRRSERVRKRGRMQKDELSSSSSSSSSEDEFDKREVEKKIGALKQIVPGGEELGVDMLFEKTAGYILALQLQLKALNYLTTFVQASDKDKIKLGG